MRVEGYLCAAVLQIGLRLRLQLIRGHRWFLQFVVDTPGFPLLPDGFMHFRPLAFVPYVDSQALRWSNCPLNLDHAFSQWLVENAAMLQENHPGLFDELRRAANAESISAALDRLRQLDPELVPLRLKISEFDFIDFNYHSL
jgi:hypothetical protein